MAKMTNLIVILVKNLLLCYEEWVDWSQVKGVERMGCFSALLLTSPLFSVVKHRLVIKTDSCHELSTMPGPKWILKQSLPLLTRAHPICSLGIDGVVSTIAVPLLYALLLEPCIQVSDHPLLQNNLNPSPPLGGNSWFQRSN